MTKQKTSSDDALSGWERAFGLLAPEQAQALAEKIKNAPKIDDAERKEIAAKELRELAAKGPRLLYDLANCRDDGWNWFWNKWHTGSKPDFLDVRDNLREIWSRQIPVSKANGIVQMWLSEQRRSLKHLGNRRIVIHPFIPDLRTGKLLPLPTNLRVRVGMACLEQYARMKVCANPDCNFSYFLGTRRTQKICEQGECTQWAQRQYAKNWWRDNRAK